MEHNVAWYFSEVPGEQDRFWAPSWARCGSLRNVLFVARRARASSDFLTNGDKTFRIDD